MPYLKIQTNQSIPGDRQQAFLEKASRAVAEGLGKSEGYVMVAFDPPRPMLFGGSGEPCAYMELKSIGLSEGKTAGLSERLCSLAEEELGIPAKRVYIEFSDAPRAMWGCDRRTFA